MDRNAAQTYRLNHPGTPVHEIDIRRLDEVALRAAGVEPGLVDVLAAGPPCQGYSAAGKRDPHVSANQLFKEVSRVARILKPKFVVIENVLGARGVAGIDFSESIRRSLHRSGYRCDAPLTLPADDFGVPQCRHRLVFVATRSDLTSGSEEIRPTHLPAGSSATDSNLPRTPSVRDTLSDLPALASGVTAESVIVEGVRMFNLSTMAHSDRVVRKIASIKGGDGPMSCRRLSDDVARTLVAGHRALPVHP
jgi:DNA (cytosine-5)-methyltransferase 1